MVSHPSVLCPIDFSEASRSALRFASTIAEHFYAGLDVVTVDEGTASAATARNLGEFVRLTFDGREPTVAGVHLQVAAGRPAIEIQRIAQDRETDLIVMSTHGRTGTRKRFFGSTTEEVLRETRVPVLVTPAGDPGPATIEDLRGRVNGVLAPVDFTADSRRQVRIARGLADAFQTSLVLLHVLEPIVEQAGQEGLVLDLQEERRRNACRSFEELLNFLRHDLHPETVIADGDPAEQIASLARERGMAAIVMGLHSRWELGPRMGSVTYRVLCQTATSVLALPPVTYPTGKQFARVSEEAAKQNQGTTLV